MSKKNIIWISRFSPVSADAAAGSRTFTYYFRAFSNDDRFDVKLISCGFFQFKNKIEEENKNVEHKIIYWKNPNVPFWSKLKNIESKFNIFNKECNLLSKTEKEAIIETLLNYRKRGYLPHAIILEWTNMVMLASEIRKIFPKTILIASEHDLTFIGAYRKYNYFKGIQKLYWKIKFNRLKRKELLELGNCDLVLIQNFDYRKTLIENGIRENQIMNLVPFYYDLSNCTPSENSKNILFYGAMGRQENYLSAIWFIDNVLPLIKDTNVKFIVLGSNPPDELKRKSGRQVIITGFVDSIIPYFQDACCFVAPLVLGAGIKVKILEAMSSGLIVLTNAIGIEGIGATNNCEYIHCETADDYAFHINKLIFKENTYKKIGNNGKDYIKSKYNIDASLDNYKNIILELTR